MTVSNVNALPPIQWLQDAFSQLASQPGSQSPQASSDTTTISQEALQLNATQIPPSSDSSQASGVNGSPQPHHHHHHHGGDGNGDSFVNQLAQQVVSDLQNATSGSPTGSGTPNGAASSSDSTSGSFINQLASQIANDLLANYQQVTSLNGGMSQSGTQTNVIA